MTVVTAGATYVARMSLRKNARREGEFTAAGCVLSLPFPTCHRV